MSYESLQARVIEAGLMERTYGAYALYALCIALGMCLTGLILVSSDSLLVQIGNALLFGFVFVQAGMLAHDLSHQQVFKSAAWNNYVALVVWTLVCGLSARGWYDKHNAHHKHVNHVGEDPDLEIPFIFSSKQIRTAPAWVIRYILPHQRWLFFVMLPLVYPNFILGAMRNLTNNFNIRASTELFLIILHFLFFFGIPFSFLPLTSAVVFCSVSLMFCGVYMGIVFAPNHKGEEVVDGRPTLWTDQITSTRNLFPSSIGFHFFGGLDLQIEHHLFPNMSRYMYPKAQRFVKDYCKEYNIRYYETTWIGSMKEIYVALKREADASAPR